MPQETIMQAVTIVPQSSNHQQPTRLYFAPMACSLATRIACYEGGIDIEYVEVDTKKKRLATGEDLLTVNPMGQVPVLEVADGARLTENTAVLQYIADRFPEANLAPATGFARARLQQWLGFIGTELHKAVFVPLLGRTLDGAVKDEARRKVALRLGLLDAHLVDHDFLLDRFSVADAYLFAVLNWAPYAEVDLTAWPSVHAYHRRLAERPQVALALKEEFALWKAEQARLAA
jgi:glutathione S-transferase